MGTIYALVSPDGICRYVGQTKQGLALRLKGHLKSAQRPVRYRDYWIAALLRGGTPPQIVALERVPLECLNQAEQWWIAHFRQRQTGLTNLTDGGEGSRGWHHSLESKAKLSAALKGRKVGGALLPGRGGAAGKGKPKSEAHRRAISKALTGNPRRYQPFRSKKKVAC